MTGLLSIGAVVAWMLISTSAEAAPAWGRYAGDHGRPTGELWAGLECALKRWRAATGMALDVSLAAAHFVRWKYPEDLPSGASARTEGPFDATRVYVSATIPAHHLCSVLVHEIGHALRRSYGHSLEDGSMSYHVTYASTSRITAADLTLVCAQQVCAWQTEEPAP